VAGTTLFGPVMQLGFVVPDLEAAARHWIRLGIGPFYLLDRVDFADCHYLGKPVDFHMSVALAQWGAVQVELIQQRDEVPTIYTNFPLARQGGLQHLGVLVDSVDDHLQRLGKEGIQPVQGGSTTAGTRFAYVDTDRLPGAHPGAMIELIERSPAIESYFERVRRAAEDWDGSRPLRGR